MSPYPLVPAFDGDAVPLGDVLDRQVEMLRRAWRSGDPIAGQVLRGTGVVAGGDELPSSPELTVEMARLVIARDHGFADWDAVREHAGLAVDTRFEAAADAIQWGDLATLRSLLDEHPSLISMRSPFVHQSMLVHYVAANGIEVERQLQSPPNAPEILRLLLDRGADPDARCDTYGGKRRDTVLYLLVSSCVPAAAGVQAAVVEELCRAGARVNGLDDDGLPLWTAISFGYTAAAQALARCGARVDNIVFHAALGDLAAVRGYFGPDGALTPSPRPSGSAAAHPLEYALIQAAGHGHRAMVEFLLGKEPDLSVTEPFFGATARGVAAYAGHTEIVALIEERLGRS